MPFVATAGPAANRPGFVLPVTLNVSVWPLSSAGPALMPVAQFGTVFAPLSSATIWSGPALNDGASLTAAIVTLILPVSFEFTCPSCTT